MHHTRSRRDLAARSPPISQEFNKYLNLKGRYPDTEGELAKRKGKRHAPTPFAATALDEIGADREVARDDEAAHQRQIAKQAQMAAKKLQQRHAEQAEEQARRAHRRPDLASTSPSRPSHHPAISARSRQAEIAQLEARLKVAEARRQRGLV